MPEPTAGNPDTFDLRIPGDLHFVGSARRFLLSVLRTFEIPESTRDEVGLVLTELCNNSIEHGARGSRSPLDIRIELSAGELRLRIVGRHLEGLDAAQLHDAFQQAKLGEDKFSERGRGLFLVATLMDDVRVEGDPRNGLVVDTVRYLDARRKGRAS